jgi:hypothetical protein
MWTGRGALKKQPDFPQSLKVFCSGLVAVGTFFKANTNQFMADGLHPKRCGNALGQSALGPRHASVISVKSID